MRKTKELRATIDLKRKGKKYKASGKFVEGYLKDKYNIEVY